MIIKFFLLIGLPISSLFGHQYKLAIGTMFKNEAPWLKEWIEYHRLLGFEHFYLYNNDSTDHYLEILDPYIKKQIVELVPWNSDTAPWHDPGENWHWVGFQLSAFNDCVKRALGKTTWLALIDVDEYIVPLKGTRSLHSLLDKQQHLGTESILFFWRCYGTSNFWEIPKGKLMIEALATRTDDSFSANGLGKSLHRPESIVYCHIHGATHKSGRPPIYVSPSQVRINHYQLRGRKDALAKRYAKFIESPEELSAEKTPDAYQWLHSKEELYNKIEDRAIEPYIPKLKARLALPTSK